MSLSLLAMMYACSPVSKDTGEQALSASDTATEMETQPDENDTGEVFEEDPEEEPCTPPTYQPNSFINEVIEYNPGDGAGFGQDSFPDIVFGPPLGAGEIPSNRNSPSLLQSDTLARSPSYTTILAPC